MYKLVLIRHGESLWNKENRFAGWVDVDLSEKGIEEAHKAGIKLKNQGFHFDLAYTSLLKRANRTLDIVLDEMNINIPIIKTWKLNERHYGSLQGLNKSEMATKYGEDQVKKWRRGYDTAIPPLSKSDSMYPGNDPLYKDLKPEEIPLSENLKMVVERVVPYWDNEIVPKIKEGKKIIISASGNSLRALIKHIEGLSPEQIVDFNMPTAIPYVYEFGEQFEIKNKFFLATPEELQIALDTVAKQGKAK